MRKFTCSLSLLALIITNFCFGQEWVRMMNDPNVNVHDVQDAFYKWYALHKGEHATDKSDIKNSRSDAEEDGYALFKRWEHYMIPRALPNGERPNTAAIAKEYKEYFDSKQAHKTTSAATWAYVGNTSVPTYGGDGRINRVHFYPGNTNIIYACSPAGGLWKSTDGGNTWATNTDQLADIGTGDLAINPLNPSIMYLATGDNDAGGTFNPTTIGVLRSNDGGNTWNTTGLNYTIAYSGTNYILTNQVIFNPLDTGTLFAATSLGVFYTKDNGTTWTQALAANIKDIEFEPFHGTTIYAGSSDGKFYRSVDSGKTFTRVISGLSSKGMGRLAIGVTAADSNIVYVLGVDSANSGFYGLYRSTDRGQTFTARELRSAGAPNLLGWSNTGSDSSGQAWYNLVIKVSPTHSDSVFVAGSWLWTSSDGGATFTFNNNFYNNVHIDIHSITFLPGSSSAFILSSDGGVFETPDAGTTWTDLSNNLAIGEQYSIGPSADNPNLFITGWQDNSCNLSGTPWQAVFGGDGMTSFIDYSSDNNMFASSENGAFGSSVDGGITWITATGGITEIGDWNTPWLQDPMQPSTLFSGFQNVWKSNDMGNTWSPIS
ncbi:MAG TPA: hypothetical protein VNY36_01125, partial [Bacteroidia bacterium]|nr:hypothetical protein [Bacteroidia bacterium]